MRRSPSNGPQPSGRLTDLIDRLGRLIRSQSYESGMAPVQWDALRYLARCNRFSNTPGALAKYLHATKGTVSQTLNVLERKGLVTKTPDANSGRVVRLALTAKGRAAAARDPAAGLAGLAAGIAPQDVRAAERVLAEMLAGTQASHGYKPFSACHSCRHFRRDAAQGAPHWCSLLDEKLSENDSYAICVESEAA